LGARRQDDFDGVGLHARRAEFRGRTMAECDVIHESTSPTPVPCHAPVAPLSPAPVHTRWSGRLRVSQIVQETPHVKTFRMINPTGGVLPFGFLPGQFLTLKVVHDGKAVRRGYTIASSPIRQDHAEITVKHEDGGLVSGYLHEHVQPGELLDVAGPYGSFTFTGDEADSIVLIGGGVGITPLMSVIRYLTDQGWPGQIHLLYGVHTPGDIVFRQEIETLNRRFANVHAVITVSHPEGTDWAGRTGRISKELISQCVPDIAARRVHVCGPASFMKAVKRMLVELGVADSQIKSDAFGPAPRQQRSGPTCA
jgi:glycine betaine catabolism B